MFFTNFPMDLATFAFYVALATTFLTMLSLSYQFTTHSRKGFLRTRAATWISRKKFSKPFPL